MADHRQLPVPDHSADLVVSGWSVSYLAVWNQENGAAELDNMAGRNETSSSHQDGTIILFESLGTGNEEPIRLEHVRINLSMAWTPMAFKTNGSAPTISSKSVEEAADLAGFFFGAEMADRVRENELRHPARMYRRMVENESCKVIPAEES